MKIKVVLLLTGLLELGESSVCAFFAHVGLITFSDSPQMVRPPYKEDAWRITRETDQLFLERPAPFPRALDRTPTTDMPFEHEEQFLTGSVPGLPLSWQ